MFDEQPKRTGEQAPDPMKSDLGRTDDVPHVNADASKKEEVKTEGQA